MKKPWVSKSNRERVISKKTRQKISKATKGENNPFYGKTHSKETKIKMSLAKIGKYDGENHPMWGKHHTEETKKHWSEIRKGKSNSPKTQFKKGMMPWNKGKTGLYNPSKETRELLSKQRRGKKPKNFEDLMKKMRSREPTSIEIKIYEELKKRGFLFERQRLINGRFLVDAYIPSLNLVIEADGDYWHSLPKVVKRDKAKNAYLKKCGFNLLRFSETEINNNDYKIKLDKVEVN